MDDVIIVKNLTKKFGNLIAVNNISFSVKKGEIFGFLGPNGAGKTTTINILSTLLKKTSGEAFINGFDVSKEKDSVRKNIGIVFQEPALDNRLTGRENLYFHARIYGLTKEESKKKIDELLKLVELENKADKLVMYYSGGMKRRLEIARGLIHDPKVLFLDEPTLGLDAQTRRHIWDYIKKLNKEKKISILLTTHYMEEADFLCERVAIIDLGKIVAIGKTKNLKDKIGGDTIDLTVRGKNVVNFIKEVKKLKKVKKIIKNGKGKIKLIVGKGEEMLPKIMKIADKNNCDILSINLKKPSLEDVFLHYTGKNIREESVDLKKEFMKRRMKMRRH